MQCKGLHPIQSNGLSPKTRKHGKHKMTNPLLNIIIRHNFNFKISYKAKLPKNTAQQTVTTLFKLSVY